MNNDNKDLKRKEYKEVYEKRSAFDKRCLEILRDTACNFYLFDNYYYGKYNEGKVCINKKNRMWEVYFCTNRLMLDKKIYDNCFDACKDVVYRCSKNTEIYSDAISYFISVMDYKYKKREMYEKKNRSLVRKLKIDKLFRK